MPAAKYVIQKSSQNVFLPDKKSKHRKILKPMAKTSDALINDIETTAQTLALAVEAEQSLEDNRINAKLSAIDRIMSRGDNQFTGKPHSFSSAEAIVNTDDEYQSYLERLRMAVRARILAKGNYDAAVAAARLGALPLV